MEILNRREQIGAKKIPPVIGEDVEKAGKSKYGVVKIGNGINVSNGVISVPGLTYDVLWEGNIIPDGETTPIELSHDLDDYKFIIACQILGGTNVTPAASILPVEFMTRQTFYSIFLYTYVAGAGVVIDNFLFAKYDTENTHYAVRKSTGEDARAIYGVNIIGIK